MKNLSSLSGVKTHRNTFSANGVKLNDVAYVYNLKNKTGEFAIYFDRGPTDKPGEVSTSGSGNLGASPNPNKGVISSNQVLNIIFPGSSSNFNGAKSITQDMINKVGKTLYDQNTSLINAAIDAASKVPVIKKYD